MSTEANKQTALALLRASAIHDGPGQGVALALMRLGPMSDLCGRSGSAGWRARTGP